MMKEIVEKRWWIVVPKCRLRACTVSSAPGVACPVVVPITIAVRTAPLVLRRRFDVRIGLEPRDSEAKGFWVDILEASNLLRKGHPHRVRIDHARAYGNRRLAIRERWVDLGTRVVSIPIIGPVAIPVRAGTVPSHFPVGSRVIEEPRIRAAQSRGREARREHEQAKHAPTASTANDHVESLALTTRVFLGSQKRPKHEVIETPPPWHLSLGKFPHENRQPRRP